MNPLPAPALSFVSTSIADLLSKPLPRHRFDTLYTLIGDAHHPATADPSATVNTSTTVVASVTTATSDSVPTLHPNPTPTLPIVFDTGASIPIAPPASDYLLVSQAPYGLIDSSDSVSHPYTLITGEDISVDPVDLLSTDTDSACFELILDLSALLIAK